MSFDRLLAAAARSLPREFRARHGEDMLDAARRLLARERERRGRRAEFVLFVRLAVDLFTAAAAERWGRLRAPGTRRATRGPIAPRRPSLWVGLGRDLRDSLRGLRRSPGHTAAVILTLTLGIGANAAIFAVVHHLLLAPLPYAEPDRLVLLWEKNAERGWHEVQAAPANLLDWRERAKSFSGVAGFTDYLEQQIVTAPGEPSPVQTMNVTGDLFTVLGAAPLLGRTFTSEETWAGGEPVAILSHRLWRSRFGGDPNVVGRQIELDRAPATIVGVMPADFSLWSDEADLWRPFGWNAARKSQVSFRRAHTLRGVARLAPDASLDAARAELESIAAALEREYPETNRAMGAGATPLRTWLVGDLRRPLVLLFVAVGLVLLIACANVAHLQLARSVAREHELALRGSLGASPWRLARRGLVDSVLASALGSTAGFALARAVVPSVARWGGTEFARAGEVTAGSAVLAFSVLLGLLAAVVSGAVPAIQARTTNLERVLREAGRGGEGRRRGSVRQLLIAAEVALAVVLVAGSIFLVRSLSALGRVSPGFESRDVLTAAVALPPLAYPDAAAIDGFSSRLLERIEAIPGVEAAGLANRLPLTGDSWSSDFSVEGRSAATSGTDVLHREVSPGYLSALRVPLVAGRRFAAGDGLDAPLVVLINQTFARRYFADQDPVGLRICFDRVPEATSFWYTIVGVVGDERQSGLGRAARPEILGSIRQDPNRGPSLVVRAGAPLSSLVPAIRGALAEIDPKLPLTSVRTMDDVVATSLARDRFMLRLFGGFALLALVLATIGVYGVVAHAAAGRRRELCIRLALGAQPREAAASLVAKSTRAVLAGALMGLGGALALGRAMSGQLYGLSASDPATLALAPLVLIGAAALATWLPAARGVRIAPAEVLRSE